MEETTARRGVDAGGAVFAAIVAPLVGAVLGSAIFFTVIPGSELATWLAPVLAVAMLTAVIFARLRGMPTGATVALAAIALAASLALFFVLILLIAWLVGGFDDVA